MKVLFSAEASDLLETLPEVLPDKVYFNFEKDAAKYAKTLADDIACHLPYKERRVVPRRYAKYSEGLLYAVFTTNKRMSWYVFFHAYMYDSETVFVVDHLTNNRQFVF